MVLSIMVPHFRALGSRGMPPMPPTIRMSVDLSLDNHIYYGGATWIWSGPSRSSNIQSKAYLKLIEAFRFDFG